MFLEIRNSNISTMMTGIETLFCIWYSVVVNIIDKNIIIRI